MTKIKIRLKDKTKQAATPVIKPREIVMPLVPVQYFEIDWDKCKEIDWDNVTTCKRDKNESI